MDLINTKTKIPRLFSYQKGQKALFNIPRLSAGKKSFAHKTWKKSSLGNSNGNAFCPYQRTSKRKRSLNVMLMHACASHLWWAKLTRHFFRAWVLHLIKKIVIGKTLDTLHSIYMHIYTISMFSKFDGKWMENKATRADCELFLWCHRVDISNTSRKWSLCTK